MSTVSSTATPPGSAAPALAAEGLSAHASARPRLERLALAAVAVSTLTGVTSIALWMFPVDGVAARSIWALFALTAAAVAPGIVWLALTDRARVERALRISERRQRLSVEHSPIGMAIVDLDGTWIMTNAALEKMLGYTPDELRFISFRDITHPDDSADAARRMQRLRSGEIDTYVVERRYLHKQGHWTWARVAVSLVRDDAGRPLNFIGQLESLEDRKRAERDLAEERERLRITLRAIADAVITMDTTGRITYINSAAEALIGQQLAQVSGRRACDVIVLTSPRTAQPVSSVHMLCLAHGQAARRDEPCILHRPDGGSSYVVDTATPVYGADGQLTGIVLVLRDVTIAYERQREISHRAAHDVVTGLVNRFEFERRAEEVLLRSRRMERAASLCVIDLDFFKAVNDRGGHAAGDEVLRKVAQALRASVRNVDTVARIGGDEFAVLLEGCNTARTRMIARKMLHSILALEVEWQGTRYSVGASIGAAVSCETTTDVASWIERADAECYAAKRSGRGQLRMAT